MENIPDGEDYYKSNEEPVKEFKFEPNEPEGDFELPLWVKQLLVKQHVWVLIALMFGAMALYSAWEHKQLTINYNEIVSMYNSCAEVVNPLGII